MCPHNILKRIKINSKDYNCKLYLENVMTVMEQ